MSMKTSSIGMWFYPSTKACNRQMYQCPYQTKTEQTVLPPYYTTTTSVPSSGIYYKSYTPTSTSTSPSPIFHMAKYNP